MGTDLSGTYAIAGRGAGIGGGGSYGGSVVITMRPDGTYDIEWARTYSPSAAAGTGSLRAGVLDFEFSCEEDGFVEEGSGTYTLGAGGQLVGSWSTGLISGTESLTPQ